MKGIENTTTTNFGDIIGNNRKYVVPLFQRDYSWKEEQWDDLWQDILTMIADDGDHYMGYLVLQSSMVKSGIYRIIDGQQRFTTITLLILAAVKAIKNMADNGIHTQDNQERYNALIKTYIGRLDPVSLEYDNILELNRNNNSFYKDYLVKMGDLRSRGLMASEKLLKQCFEWYEQRVNERKMSDVELADFIVRIAGNLYFTVITVNDDMNAFRVFETLNARGVQLSSADLLKNYLFSLIDDGDSANRIKDLEHKWNNLAHNIRAEKLPDFIRYFWNSKNKNVRSAELFKAIRKNITTATEVFHLVNEMMEYSDIYMALKDSDDELWNHNQDICPYIELLTLFGLKQPYSLLMTSYKNLPLEEFTKVLKSIIMVCFRYNVICGKNPNDIEKVFNDMARMVSRGEQPDYTLLQRVYVPDNEFENSFATKSFILTSRNIKVVKYILGKIESQVTGHAMIDLHDDTNSLEHILPQNPNDSWDIDEFRAEQLVNRLGNLCLLEKSINRDLGNKSYSEKSIVYQTSGYATTSHIPLHYQQWTEKTIVSRQQQMAKHAKGIWKLQNKTKKYGGERCAMNI